MAGFNEDVANSFTRHAVDLARFEAGERRAIVAILRDLESELIGRLASSRSLTSWQQSRLESLLLQTQETIATAYVDMQKMLRSDYNEFSQTESEWVRSSINRVAGIELASVAVPAEVLRAAASTAMLNGVPQRDWWDTQTSQTQLAFSGAVRQGVLSGETIDAITKRVVNVIDGTTRRNAEALVRTGLSSVTTAARLETYMANDDVIEAIQQRSILDLRTSVVCRSYSGLMWKLPTFEPIDHKLPWNGGPPRHWNCRSTSVPVVKAWKQLRDLKTGGRSADADSYFRKRLSDLGLSSKEVEGAVREQQAALDGSVPADWNYESWLKTRPADEQIQVLGPTKYRLWKAEKLTFSELVDETGRPLTVTELRAAFDASLPELMPEVAGATSDMIDYDNLSNERRREMIDARFNSLWQGASRPIPPQVQELLQEYENLKVDPRVFTGATELNDMKAIVYSDAEVAKAKGSAAFYSPSTHTVVIAPEYDYNQKANLAHEIGHYWDHEWFNAREVYDTGAKWRGTINGKPYLADVNAAGVDWDRMEEAYAAAMKEFGNVSLRYDQLKSRYEKSSMAPTAEFQQAYRDLQQHIDQTMPREYSMTRYPSNVRALPTEWISTTVEDYFATPASRARLKSQNPDTYKLIDDFVHGEFFK